ncbi:MAG: hypothetical protein ABW182_11305 [Sphingomonas sp.]
MTRHFLNWAAGLIGLAPAPERPETRLTEAQVLEIAREALAGDDFAAGMPLVVRGVADTDDGVVWFVYSATRGCGVSLQVADADGRVIEILRRSGR